MLVCNIFRLSFIKPMELALYVFVHWSSGLQWYECCMWTLWPKLGCFVLFSVFWELHESKTFFQQVSTVGYKYSYTYKSDKTFSQLTVVIWSFLFSVQVPSPAWAKSLESLTRNAFLLCKWELQCKDFFPNYDQIPSQNYCQKILEPQWASFHKNINVYFCLQKPYPVNDCLSKHSETRGLFFLIKKSRKELGFLLVCVCVLSVRITIISTTFLLFFFIFFCPLPQIPNWEMVLSMIFLKGQDKRDLLTWIL